MGERFAVDNGAFRCHRGTRINTHQANIGGNAPRRYLLASQNFDDLLFATGRVLGGESGQFDISPGALDRSGDACNGSGFIVLNADENGIG